ncbi:hypothetical protein V492_05915 [Pseudogymnoascus sp. VKM F-4246]|nr:hypothetical protein V492_05915 [Pseudogymnoascus sp. VKM F-4246]
MLLHAPEARLVTLLRGYYRSPLCLSSRNGERAYGTARVLATSPSGLRRHQPGHPPSKRSLTTTSGQPPSNIAILGGGITGLVIAAVTAKLHPNSKITLYESSDRLGGWVHSSVVESSDGPVVFELGPRSLRPTTLNGYHALSLAQQVGLEQEMVFTSHESAAGSNRFIYYPDKLVRLPSPADGVPSVLWAMLTNPLFEGLLLAVFRELTVPCRPRGMVDESIGGFLRRRLSGAKGLVDNLASAGMHGIYAGDVNQLSVRSLVTRWWEAEGKYGSVTAGMMKSKPNKYGQNGTTGLHESGEQMVGKVLGQKARASSIYSFTGGMQALPDAVASTIRRSKNVDIRMATGVSGIRLAKDGQSIQIKTTNNEPPRPYDHVISTLPAHRLAPLVPIPSLALIPYTTVMVVNLYYTNPNLIPQPGFGYLIPQSVPFKQNPELALGVVFDSHGTPGVDNAPGTKLTIMIGGHYWDGRKDDEFPTPEEGRIMAERVLARHLKITEKPDRVLATLHKNCIPQYTVGHHDRLQNVDAGIKREFGGRLSVGGSWVDGVGVNDCVLSGAFAALTLGKGRTGLELALESRDKVKAMLPDGFLL